MVTGQKLRGRGKVEADRQIVHHVQEPHNKKKNLDRQASKLQLIAAGRAVNSWSQEAL